MAKKSVKKVAKKAAKKVEVKKDPAKKVAKKAAKKKAAAPELTLSQAERNSMGLDIHSILSRAGAGQELEISQDEVFQLESLLSDPTRTVIENGIAAIFALSSGVSLKVSLSRR